MISSNVSSADGNNAGLWIELDAILAVVIGGTSLAGGRFSLGGTVVGALIIQTLTTTVYTIGIPPETTLLFKALVVIARLPASSRPAFRAKVVRPAAPARPPPRRPAASSRETRGAGMTATAAAAAAPASKLPQQYVPVLATLALLIVMYVIGALRYPAFATGQVVLNIFIDNAFLLVVAVGMTFVILTGGIDLSVGSVVALSTMLVRALLQTPGLAAVARASRCVLLVGALLGLRDGLRDPLLRDPAVHRHARRHVPRPRPVLRDQHRLDPDHRPVL